jgi:hypothetical protein
LVVVVVVVVAAAAVAPLTVHLAEEVAELEAEAPIDRLAGEAVRAVEAGSCRMKALQVEAVP